MEKQLLAFIGCLLLSSCDWGIDTYEIHDVSKKHIFRPEVRLETYAYSIHVEGQLEGEAEVYLLSPNFDLSKQFGCVPNQGNKLPSGKVNTYFENSIHFEMGEKPYLYYLPCTAKKGHLKVRISFSKYLKKE
jgi:hypothetical protein